MNATLFLAGCILFPLAAVSIIRALITDREYEKERIKYLEQRRKK